MLITHIKMRYRPNLILDFDLSCQESILPGSWGWCYSFPVVPTYYFKTTWGMNLDLVEIINQNESLALFSKSLYIFFTIKSNWIITCIWTPVCVPRPAVWIIAMETPDLKIVMMLTKTLLPKKFKPPEITKICIFHQCRISLCHLALHKHIHHLSAFERVIF